jgi:hypothetical protein
VIDRDTCPLSFDSENEWQSRCTPLAGTRWRLTWRERNIMKSKAHAVSRVLEMAENRASACQIPGHSVSVSCILLPLFGLVALLMVIAG